MLSTFNYEKLNSFLKDFYTITGIRITIFDEAFNELTSYPIEVAEACRYIRKNPKAKQACADCDRKACRKVAKLKRPYVYRCHAGLTEAVAPVYMGNLPVAYLMFGHLLSYPSYEAAQKIITESCEKYELDNKTLIRLIRKLPLTDEDTILAASRILMAVTSWLCLDRMITLRQQELPAMLDEYIMKNLSNPLDAKTLCDHFHIGRTTLYKLANENYGEGIAEHIRSLRIEYAKKLLKENKSLTLSEIAEQCGFSDYNYFITVFSRLCGISPARYRRS